MSSRQLQEDLTALQKRLDQVKAEEANREAVRSAYGARQHREVHDQSRKRQRPRHQDSAQKRPRKEVPVGRVNDEADLERIATVCERCHDNADERPAQVASTSKVGKRTRNEAKSTPSTSTFDLKGKSKEKSEAQTDLNKAVWALVEEVRSLKGELAGVREELKQKDGLKKAVLKVEPF